MSRVYSIGLRGIESTVQRLKRAAGYMSQSVSERVEETVLDIEANAKARAPVDMGKLRQSIHGEMVSPVKGKISANISYAPFQEFGTGGYVSIPEGWEEVAAQFKGKRRVNMKPQPYLIPAVKKGLQDLKNKIRLDIRNLPR